jgi:hypothetical protein
VWSFGNTCHARAAYLVKKKAGSIPTSCSKERRRGEARAAQSNAVRNPLAMRKSQRPQRLLKRGLVATGVLPSSNSAALQVQDYRVFTTCPECGAELQAALKIYLYGVAVNSAGLLIKYDGGPQPENENDILELCDLQNTTVYCANDHVFNSDTTVRTKRRAAA